MKTEINEGIQDIYSWGFTHHSDIFRNNDLVEDDEDYYQEEEDLEEE